MPASFSIFPGRIRVGGEGGLRAADGPQGGAVPKNVLNFVHRLTHQNGKNLPSTLF